MGKLGENLKTWIFFNWWETFVSCMSAVWFSLSQRSLQGISSGFLMINPPEQVPQVFHSRSHEVMCVGWVNQLEMSEMVLWEQDSAPSPQRKPLRSTPA